MLDKPMAAEHKSLMRFSAVIVAAGSGVRAGGDVPKQWRNLAGKPMARWSVDAFLTAGARQAVLVVRPGEEAAAEAAMAGAPRLTIVAGGAERLDSVLAGLDALKAHAPDAVLIHDAARPLVERRHIESLLNALEHADGAIPALAASDTLKRTDKDGRIVATPSRDGLWRAQTPQAFRWQALMDAYAAFPASEKATDDAQVLERAGGHVVVAPGDPLLMKATFPEDFEMLDRLTAGARIVRTGQGFDAHRFAPGDSVWLCGVNIPHTHSLLGHSDADAGLHALTDAILGAVGEGDIGDHFPPTDPKWKGAASDQFLLHAVELVAAKGGQLVNVDVTLICERPKVKPHRAAMRERIAELLKLPLDRVSVKATTMEGMGFTGREEGIAASAIATVETGA